MPLLSVCIPTFNNARGLRVLLENMLPLPDDAEIVVSNNASTDNTDGILWDFKKNLGDRLTIHTQDRNVGFSANVAGLPTLATGEYVWMMGDDNNILTAKTMQVVIDYIRITGAAFMIVNRLFVGKKFVDQGNNEVDFMAANKLNPILVTDEPTSLWPMERQVFHSFNEAVDRFFHYFQWLCAAIIQRNILEKNMKEAFDVALQEPHIFSCVLAVTKFPLHYLGDVYIRSLRKKLQKEAYYQRDRDPVNKQTKHLDFIYICYELPALVLKYLEDKHGVYVHPSPDGFFVRQNDSRFVKKYAAERRKGITHRADNKHVAMQFIKLKRYWFLYCILRASPLFLVRIVWFLYLKGFYLGRCVQFYNKACSRGRRLRSRLHAFAHRF